MAFSKPSQPIIGPDHKLAQPRFGSELELPPGSKVCLTTDLVIRFTGFTLRPGSAGTVSKSDPDDHLCVVDFNGASIWVEKKDLVVVK